MGLIVCLITSFFATNIMLVDKVEKIDADSAYEAAKKTNLKNIDKILYVSENVCMKNIFPSNELIKQD